MDTKILIAILTCNQGVYAARRDACLATWAKNSPVDVKCCASEDFGIPAEASRIYTNPTGHVNIPGQSLNYRDRAICAWTLSKGYTHMFKADDDVYVWIDRLLKSGFQNYAYSGYVVPARPWYCSGGAGYWLNRQAMHVIANSAVNDCEAEDWWVGGCLGRAGIHPHSDPRYVGEFDPVVKPDQITLHAIKDPAMMYQIHTLYGTPDLGLNTALQAELVHPWGSGGQGTKVVPEYARRFGLNTMFETGTCQGRMIATMLPQLNDIYSVELSPTYFAEASARFAGNAQVHLYQGNSAEVLKQVLPSLSGKRLLFWLDAHYSEGDTAKLSDDLHSPIVTELDAIFALSPNAVILIDDARMFTGEKGYPTLIGLRDYVAYKAPGWTFEVRQDIIRIHQ